MTDRPFKPLVILMPVLEDRQSARRLIVELAKECPVQPFVVVVEDGSLGEVMDAGDISEAGLDGEVVYLARNLGHQRAIAAGLTYVAGTYDANALVVMDSDGEDDPAAIPLLLDELEAERADVVVAERRRRSESWQFRSFYTVYRRLFQVLTGRVIRFGNFMALSGRAVQRVSRMQEAWVHFPASIMISRLRVCSVPTDRGKRYFGQSRMNFVALSLHGMRSMMVFAEDVLVRVGLFCVFLMVLSVALLGVATIMKLVASATGLEFLATPGWFSTASGLLIIILLQAGILSFVTLMVAGVVKGAAPLRRTDLDLLIDRIESTRTVPVVRVAGVP